MIISCCFRCRWLFVLLGLLPLLAMVPHQQAQAKTVPLCQCSEAAQCADQGFQRVRECKRSCAHWLRDFAQGDSSPEALTDCFGKDVTAVQGRILTDCMHMSTPRYCSPGNLLPGKSAVLEEPDYGTWMETISAPNNKTGPAPGSAFLRKARTAFIAFRNFQKCNNNCAKKHATECFQSAGCAVTLPENTNRARSIFNACTLQGDGAKSGREACRCLIQKHKCYQLIGVCPLFSNAFLQHLH